MFAAVLGGALIAINPPVLPWVMRYAERIGPIPLEMAWIVLWILAVGFALLWMYLGDEAEAGR